MADESSCPARCVFLLQMNVAKLQKMVGDVRTGGKGTVRRYAPCGEHAGLVAKGGLLPLRV